MGQSGIESKASVLVNEDPLKNEDATYRVYNIFSIIGLLERFRYSRASNSDDISSTWTDIELVRSFISVLITCKFDEDPIKMKGLSCL